MAENPVKVQSLVHSLMLLRDVPLKLLDPADARELRGVNEPGEFRRV